MFIFIRPPNHNWNLYKMFAGTYLQRFIKIKSVTAEMLLTLSLCGGWGEVVYKVIFVSNPTKVMLGFVLWWLDWQVSVQISNYLYLEIPFLNFWFSQFPFALFTFFLNTFFLKCPFFLISPISVFSQFPFYPLFLYSISVFPKGVIYLYSWKNLFHL